jgi:uncharacterized membrane protein
MMRSISRNFLTGLFTILPVTLTIYLFYWIAVSAELLLSTMLRTVLPEGWYQPGMGVAAALMAIYSMGLLMHAMVARRLFNLTEQFLSRLPFINTVYFAIRDLVDYFSPDRKSELGQVVSVTIGDTGMQLFGFVTRTDFTQLPSESVQQDSVLVYLPMSYQIGGYAVLVPRSAVQPVNMRVEDAMRFILTAGAAGEHSKRS